MTRYYNKKSKTFYFGRDGSIEKFKDVTLSKLCYIIERFRIEGFLCLSKQEQHNQNPSDCMYYDSHIQVLGYLDDVVKLDLSSDNLNDNFLKIVKSLLPVLERLIPSI